MEERLRQLKAFLYDALVEGSEEQVVGDVQNLYQNLGVQITKAVQKEGGVNIIQVQTAIGRKVINNIVSALKMIDEMEDPALVTGEVVSVKELEAPSIRYKRKRPSDKTLGQLLDDCHGNKSEVARRLGVPASTLCMWVKKLRPV